MFVTFISTDQDGEIAIKRLTSEQEDILADIWNDDGDEEKFMVDHFDYDPMSMFYSITIGDVITLTYDNCDLFAGSQIGKEPDFLPYYRFK